MEEPSLAIDIETLGYGGKKEVLARIAVVGTRGCTRDGSAATISADCHTPSALAREVERLRAELEQALEQGSAALGVSTTPASGRRGTETAPADTRDRPRLETDACVRDVMTRDVRSVGPNDPLSAAKALMDAGHFRHVVVLDEEGGIAGVLSDRDVGFGPLAWSMGQGEAGYERILEATQVKQAMRSDVSTIEAGAPLAAAAAQMCERQIGCLPVVEAERLIGIISESDLLGLLAEAPA